ncbi:hypothetical protein BDZ89DRAFT_1258726 [Hymenopellis radicata]|nr:hypothetical protein BDZ89DRAFT_1258726 [Hymenopellis radicata]
MASTIVGTLPVSHSVDSNGSLAIDIPLQVPPAKMAPKLSLSYHSAAITASTVGMGWALRGASMIERVAATKAQDGYRGVVNYDKNDRFSLDGQRLVYISGSEYRFEMEQWSKLVASGDPENPTSWTEYLPDGSTRVFGTTADSNIKAVGQDATRVWAVSQYSDAFSNYISYKYTNDTTNGSFYLNEIAYGGNQTLSMAHQRQITFEYESRPDISTKYVGGSLIRIDQRLKSISSLVRNNLVHKHLLAFDAAPLTGVSRVASLTLVDPSGASVRPLQFDWVNGSPAVFDEPAAESTLEYLGADVDILSMDINATGKSDVVLASMVSVGGMSRTRIASHKVGAGGQLPPTPDSVFSDLPYHVALFPLDVDGDGTTDLVHISLGGSVYTITVLLSTATGFQAQPSLTFTPQSTDGFFRCGDFEGNGHIGLIYISRVGGSNIKFVQFVSDGKGFTAKDAADGPTNVAIDDMRVVVGDLTGNGEEDVFILTPKTKDGRQYCYISFLESLDGTLTYQPNDALAQAGESIAWSESTTFVPYSIDEDGKTSLLVASKKTLNSHLVLQVLRSDGRTLLPSPSAIETDVLYDGNLGVTRTSSTNTLDIINTFNMPNASPPRTNIYMLRYRDGSFDGPSYLSATWGDFRGIGRTDLLLNTQVQGKFNIRAMPCASSQPVDFLSGYVNGLGARIDVTFAPLSDDTTYETDSGVSSVPVAASNAMARNISSVANLSSSTVSNTSHTRSEIVYFPSWVVKGVVSTPYAANAAVKEQTGYTYRNARFEYDGRGWLGFEKLTKSSTVLGTSESTWYLQKFPFIGQADRTETTAKTGDMLQTREYTWNDILNAAIANRNHSIQLSGLSEVYYEGGAKAYTANAAYTYDAFGNITELTIVSPEVGAPALTISSTYDNATDSSWVIGNKTREVIKQASGTVLKDSQFAYISATQSPKEMKAWVKDSEWSTRTTEYDAAGNETVIHGPGPAQRRFVYDDTYSNITSSTTLVSTNGDSLTETTTYSLENGKPSSFTDANGSSTSFTYDVLGRLQDTYQEDANASKTLIKTESYLFEDNQFAHVTDSRTAWDQDEWFRTVEYVDGLEKVWRTERPRPDATDIICSDTEYDGAGRTTAISRDYFASASPEFSQYTYDARSRIVQEVIPPSSSDLPSTTVTTQYSFASGLSESVKTSSTGGVTKTSSQQTLYLPNADKPSVDNLLTPYVVASSDELGQQVETAFDGLGRPFNIQDPNGVQLALSWDGLSRLIERRISQDENGTKKDINHASLIYDDDNSLSTVQNVITGETNVVTYDLAKRPISMVSPDEKKLTYTYDTGSDYAKGRLMSVTSESTGVSHIYNYDIRGQLTKDALQVDGQSYTTSYEWSPLGQLLSIVNPDGSTLNRALFADGESVSRVELADAGSTVKATVALSRYEDVFGRPLACDFGNGLSSLSSIYANGAISSIALSKGTQGVHLQEWRIDEFDRINDYQRVHNGDTSASVSFQYDVSGQLTQSMISDPNARDIVPQEYAYDASGNLSEKDGKLFVNQGWKLSSVKNPDGGTEFSFTYSNDGNILEKLDSSGAAMKTMKYDSQGRLVQVNDTRMLYDFGGRLIKCTRANGDVTIYANQAYEVNISSSGKKTHAAYLVHGYRRASLTHEEGGSAEVYYYHNDHLGSTVAVSDSQGSLVTQYKYDAFGQVTIEGDDLARYKFSGKELIEDFYNFGARFYDPSIGRFLTLDNYPVDLEDINPSTFNMYAFSRNNPVNFIDMNGNAPWWHWFIDVALIVAGAALMFIPVVGPIAVIAMGALSGAVIGAGFAGLSADIGGASDKEWGIQMGLGAVFGALTGGAGAAVDVALPAAAFTTRSAAGVGKWVQTTVTNAVVKGAINKGLGVVQQVVDNAVHGRAAGEGLLEMIPGMGSEGAGFDWQGLLETGALVGLGLVASSYKGSHPKIAGKYYPNLPGGQKPGKLASLGRKLGLVKESGLKATKYDYPLGQTVLDVGKYRATGASRYMSMSETTNL